MRLSERWCGMWGIWEQSCSYITRSPRVSFSSPRSSLRSLPATSARHSSITFHSICGSRFTCGRITTGGVPISIMRCYRPIRRCCSTDFSAPCPTSSSRLYSGASPGREPWRASRSDSSTSGGATPPSLDGVRPRGSELPSGSWASCFPRTMMAITETPISSLAIFFAFTIRRLERFWRGSLRRAAEREMPAGAPRGGCLPEPNREIE